MAQNLQAKRPIATGPRRELQHIHHHRSITPKRVFAPTRCNSTVAQQEQAAKGWRQLRWELQTSIGRMIIRPLERDEAQAAGVVVARAFASSPEAVPLSEALKDIEAIFLENPSPAADADSGAHTSSREATLDGYFLVARLFPDDPQQTPLPPGQGSRIVGTASISLSASSPFVRRLPSVNLPPSDAAYISNMAVDPRFRRRGVARALLAACEDVARSGARADVWLHVLEADEAARALYGGAGFVAAAKDSWLDTLKRGGGRPRILMRRELQLS
ncbi:hypothetical protein Vretimale_14180 [Volvox reticuliferus]|uniref:N-acetyltransferase domain-containing protein n=1 Tax=Volvox reticuliferus TaxID=1737510 RepID=A0A8J4GP83_9CHLO|nr:hypothetical protein Vretifemale_15208 [Volvox reticuliferus]GIM10586.1 hypothetical protein Vretimale_14180 [Volvox reticuliferus]